MEKSHEIKNIKNKSENSSSDSDSEDKKIPDVCLVCKKEAVMYKCYPCGCPILCRKCAMKMASGGYCKSCKQMFVELQRINK